MFYETGETYVHAIEEFDMYTLIMFYAKQRNLINIIVYKSKWRHFSKYK